MAKEENPMDSYDWRSKEGDPVVRLMIEKRNKKGKVMKTKETLISITHIFLGLLEKHEIKYKLQEQNEIKKDKESFVHSSDEHFAIIWFDNSCCLEIYYNNYAKCIYASFIDRFLETHETGIFDELKSDEEIERLCEKFNLKPVEHNGVEDFFYEYIFTKFEV